MTRRLRTACTCIVRSLLKSTLLSCAPVLKSLWGTPPPTSPNTAPTPLSSPTPRTAALPSFITSQFIGVDEAETFVALADLLVRDPCCL